MDARVINKAKLPSRHVTVGPARAPHRSYLYAMGLSAEEIAQPLVGVASCWNEAAPCTPLCGRPRWSRTALLPPTAPRRELLHHHSHRRHCHGRPGDVRPRLFRVK